MGLFVNRQILIVDDEPALLSAVSRLLAEDYDVYTACNAEEALSLIEILPTFPVIATDVMMPGMSGIRFAQRLASVSPSTVVIVFSSNDFNTDRLEHLKNAKACLAKPFSVTMLCNAIEQFMGQPQLSLDTTVGRLQ